MVAGSGGGGGECTAPGGKGVGDGGLGGGLVAVVHASRSSNTPVLTSTAVVVQSRPVQHGEFSQRSPSATHGGGEGSGGGDGDDGGGEGDSGGGGGLGGAGGGVGGAGER
jgi:hypothetical protein